MNRVFTVLLAACAMALPAQVSADVAGEIIEEAARKVFSERERRIINEYYGEKRAGYRGHPGRGAPHGVGRGGGLPPGLRMQLERFGRLPPGLEKKGLPTDLIGRLPPAPWGYERVIVDTDVVLVETASQIIVDIINDVVYEN